MVKKDRTQFDRIIAQNLAIKDFDNHFEKNFHKKMKEIK